MMKAAEQFLHFYKVSYDERAEQFLHFYKVSYDESSGTILTCIYRKEKQQQPLCDETRRRNKKAIRVQLELEREHLFKQVN